MFGWGWNKVGHHFAARIYNVFVHSTIGFTAQVARLSREVTQAEIKALRRAASGPGNWITTADLWHLKDLGLPSSSGARRPWR